MVITHTNVSESPSGPLKRPSRLLSDLQCSRPCSHQCFRILDLRPVFHCGGDLVKESGFVGSEGFPNYYKPNSKCTWRITVSHWPQHSCSPSLKRLTHTQSAHCLGPRGKRGHAHLPHFWHGGRLTVSIRLSGRLQRTFQLGAKTGTILRNLPPRCSHFNHKHHDAGDGDWWRDAESRIRGPFQRSQTICWWWGAHICSELLIFGTAPLKTHP